MAKIHIENGIISSSADYGLYHGTSEIAKVEAGGLRVQGDVTAENLIVSSSVTFMTQSFSSGSTIFGDTPADDTHQFTGSVSISGSTGLSVTDGNIISHGTYAVDIDGDHSGGPRITMGDYDSTPNNFMSFGAYSSINNLDTVGRDFRIFDSGGFTGYYFDVSENKVGIGTTSPQSTLTVAGDISGSGNLHLKNNKAFWMASAAGNAFYNAIFTDTDDKLIFRTNNTLAMAIDDANQRVAIGHSSPDNVLHVSTGDNVVAKFESTDANATLYLVDNSTSNASTFKRTANDLKILENGGNVLFPGTNVKISGSSTSTGSFGHIKVGDNFTFNPSTTPVLTITGTRNDILFLESDTTDLNTLVRHQSGLFRIDTINDALDTVSLRFHVDHSTGNISIGSSEDATKFLQFRRGGSGTGTVRGSIGTNNSKLTFIGGSGTSAQMTLDSSGQLGIGTTSPEQLLHLRSEAPFLAFTDSSNNSESGILYRNTSGTNVGFSLYDFGNNAFKIRTNNSLALTIDSAQDATFAGHIALAATKGIFFDGGSHTSIAESSGDNLRFQVGASNVLDITTTKISGSSTSTGSFGQGYFDGRVGIGAVNPDVSATALDQLVVGYPGVGGISTGTNHAGIVIGTGNTHIGRISFLDTPTAYGGAIEYYHGAGAGGVDLLQFYTDGFTRRLVLEGNKISGSAASTGSFGQVQTNLAIIGDQNGYPILKGASGVTDLFIGGDVSNVQILTAHLLPGGDSNRDLGSPTRRWQDGFFTNVYASGFVSASAGDGGLELKPSSRDAILTYTDRGTDRWNIWNDQDLSGVNNVLRFDTSLGSSNMVIKQSGEVGIGTTGPEGLLHIHTADASIAPNADGDELVVENSGNAGISILSGNTSNGAIFFGDAQDNNVGIIDYDHNVNQLSFTTGATKAMTINASSNVGIGTTNPPEALTVTGDISASLDIHLGGRIRHAGELYINPTTNLRLLGNVMTFGSVSGTEYARFDSSGRLGIGNTNPGKELHIGDGTGIPDLKLSGTNTGTNPAATGHGASNIILHNASATDGNFSFIDGNNSNDAVDSRIVFIHDSHSSRHGEIGFLVHNGSALTERVRLDKDGNFGIGTTSPDYALDVAGNAGINEYLYHNGDTNTYLRFQADQTDLSAGGNVISITSTGTTIADTKTLGTSTFISGITGDGFRIDDNGSNGTFLEIDNIFVRNTLRTHIFQKDVVKATNGILFISDSGVISGSSNSAGTVTFEDSKSATFDDNDILLFKDVPDQGAQAVVGVRFQINGSSTVGNGSNGVQSGFTRYNVDNVDGDLDDLNVGGTAARISGGTVAIDASSNHSPFIDVNASSGSAVVRMGKLSGITSPVFGSLGEEFGLWASGSVYLEGSINATSGGFIAGWSLNSNTIEKIDSNGGVKIDSSNKRIDFLSDASTTRLRVGQVDSNKFGIRGFNNGGNRVFEISEVRNEIAGWSIQETVISSSDGNVQIDAGNSRFLIKSGSGERVRMGLLNDSKQYGISGSDENGNLLFKLGDAGNEIAGWRIAQGKLDFDHPTGSIAIDASNKNIAIYTGSIDAAKPKVVMGNLPTTGDARYGFAVFSGSADADISDDNSYAVLITKDKARLAGWDLVPGRLKSGTVADINGNNASIALGGGSGGTNALNAGSTPTSNLFFVSASSNPIFYVGENFSYVNDVLTAAGWTIDTQAITKTVSTDTKGVSLNSGASVLLIHGTDGKDNFAGTGKNNVRVGVGRLGVNKFGIAGFDGSGNELFKLGEDGNEIAGWTISSTQISKDDIAINSNNGYIKVGTVGSSTDVDRTTKGIWLDDDGTFLMKAGTSANLNYIQSSGGNLIVSMSNFSVQASGDVSMTGTVTATSGEIGGYTIGSGKLSVGSDPGVNISGSGVIIAGNISSPGPEDAVYFGVLRENGGSSGISGSVPGLVSGDSNVPTFNSGTHLGFQINKGVYFKAVNDEAQFRVGGTSTGQPFINFNQSTPSLEISSSNFHLDASGNVDMTGTINATAGAIGGFTIANNDITGSGGIFVTRNKSTISGGPSSGTDDTRRVELLPANLRIRSGAGDPLSVNGFDASHIIFDAISTGSFNYSDGETTNYVRRVSTRMENAQFGIYDTSDSFTSGNIFIGKGVRPNASIRNQLADTNADSMIYPDTTNGGFIVMESLEVKARPSNTNANITRNYTNARFSVVGQSYLGNTELQGDVVLGYNSGDTIIFSGSIDSDVNIGATRKLYLDGGSNTYITETSADALHFVVGGSTILELDENGSAANNWMAMQATNRFYLDGGSNTYMYEVSSDNIRFVTGGTSALNLNSTGATVYGDLFVNDYARIDALRVGTTSTDPGDGQLYVEGDITVADDLFVGDCAHIDALHVGTGTDTDPGDGNLSVDGNILINGITDAGGVPKFLVRRTSDTAALVSSTWTTIVFNGEDFDTGSDFNVTNGIFSAPVAGYYHFSWQLRFNNISTATDYIWTRLNTTDEEIYAGIARIDDFANSTIAYWGAGGSATVHLDAGDTAQIQAIQISSATSVTIDGASSNWQSWFSGHMII